MHEQTAIQRVRIYLSERDRSAGQPLYLAALERLRREGATGATALRGVAGFGPGHRLRTAGAAELNQSPPIVIEWVDRAERIARVLPLLDELLPDALITIEDLRIHRATLRSAGPFGERALRDVLDRDVATAEGAATLRSATEQLIARDQPLLPVLDEQRRLAGVLAGAELVRRGSLALHPRLARTLAPPEQAALLAEMPERTVAEIMTVEPRTIYVEASIPQAIGMLVEWGLEALPAIDRDGRFAGMFSVESALRAALEARTPTDGPVRDAEPPITVGLVMQSSVPTVDATESLGAALAQLLAAPLRALVVVEDGKPIGMLDDAQVMQRLDPTQRAAWLAAQRAPGPLAPAIDSDMHAGDIAAPIPAVTVQTTELEAIGLMLDGGHEHVVVVDADGRLAGLLARRGLLRALAQESAA
jgi:CBS-domain-containing membrane protein